MEVKIDNGIGREVRAYSAGSYVYLNVKDIDTRGYESARLDEEQAREVGAALTAWAAERAKARAEAEAKAKGAEVEALARLMLAKRYGSEWDIWGTYTQEIWRDLAGVAYEFGARAPGGGK